MASVLERGIEIGSPVDLNDSVPPPRVQVAFEVSSALHVQRDSTRNAGAAAGVS